MRKMKKRRDGKIGKGRRHLYKEVEIGRGR